MENVINKIHEITDKGEKNKKDSKENPIKVAPKYYKSNEIDTFTSNKRCSYDRGDSKKVKSGDVQIKYDATKINKAVEVNLNVIRRNNVANQISTQLKTSCTLSKDERNKKSYVKILAKESSLKKNYSKSNSVTGNTLQDDTRSRVRLKEVITIPYIATEETSNTELHTETGSNVKLKNVANPKTVTFKDQNVALKQKGALKPIEDFKSGRTKVGKRKRRKKQKSSPSPIKSTINDTLPTEVIKWSPSCLTSDTTPYYKAWVDTSLTAFSKCSEKEKTKLEKELEAHKRPLTPELVYERLNDETYTGRIRIRRG